MRSALRNVFLAVLFLVVAAPSAFADKASYSSLITQHARANGIPVDIAHAVVRHESNFNPGARGRAGEIGLMQIKLQTARGIGYRGSAKGLYDPATNIEWGMKYLGEARRLSGGSECGMLSRYNGGLGRKGLIRSYCRGVLAHR